MEPHEIEELAQQAVDRALPCILAKVRQAADEGVTAALERVGINPGDPIEVQRDLAFLRDWRHTAASVRRKGLLTAVGVLVAGGLGLLWLGLRAILAP